MQLVGSVPERCYAISNTEQDPIPAICYTRNEVSGTDLGYGATRSVVSTAASSTLTSQVSQP
eukprot:620411-Rhodomonas_salina.2